MLYWLIAGTEGKGRNQLSAGKCKELLMAGGASLMAQMVKILPAMPETWVLSPGRKDPLEQGLATHSIILAWRIPRTEESVPYSPWGHKELDTTEPLTISLMADII